MMYFDNPKTIEIDNTEYPIRTDYRDILTILEAFEDKNLTKNEKLEIMITILFIDIPPITEEVFEKAYMFIDADIEGLSSPIPKLKNQKKINEANTRLYSFVKDWQLIVAAMNKYFGYSIREVKYLHWWDFLAAFNNLGKCSFTDVVDLRYRKRTNKLSAEEKRYYYKNRSWLDLDYEEYDLQGVLDTLNKREQERR